MEIAESSAPLGLLHKSTPRNFMNLDCIPFAQSQCEREMPKTESTPSNLEPLIWLWLLVFLGAQESKETVQIVNSTVNSLYLQQNTECGSMQAIVTSHNFLHRVAGKSVWNTFHFFLIAFVCGRVRKHWTINTNIRHHHQQKRDQWQKLTAVCCSNTRPYGQTESSQKLELRWLNAFSRSKHLLRCPGRLKARGPKDVQLVCWSGSHDSQIKSPHSCGFTLLAL